jgi:hypothetical protein
MHTNQYRTAEYSRPSSSQRTVEHNGKRFVDDDIAQQQCDQDPMLSLLQQVVNLLRVPLFFSFAGGSYHLEVNTILPHQSGENNS